MANFPTVCAKITKHKPSRYMFYQPGFNESNSCWLTGKWINVSKEEYDEKHELQNEMYSNLREMSKGQYYKDEGIAPKNMTPAQRQAFEFFSGTCIFECLINGHSSPIRVNIAGNKRIWERDIKWMRQRGFQIIRWIKSFDKVINQVEGMEIPEDLIIDKKKPVDTVKMTIDQNKEKNRLIFKELMEQAHLMPQILDNFYISMAIQFLLDLEENIIRAEWEEKYKKINRHADDLYKDDLENYISQRAELKEYLQDNFDSIYDRQKNEHNECERANLENHNHDIYCWVLPKFNDDGTHESWTEKDVPKPEKE